MKLRIPSELTTRNYIFFVIGFMAWVLIGLVIYGILDPDERLTQFNGALHALFGVFLALVLTFALNRRGQQEDFFYQKQIDAVMTLCSLLGDIWQFRMETDDELSVGYFLRYIAFLQGPNPGFVDLWIKRASVNLDPIRQEWGAIVETIDESRAEFWKRYKIIDSEDWGISQILDRIRILMDINESLNAAMFAKVLNGAMKEKLNQELEKVMQKKGGG